MLIHLDPRRRRATSSRRRSMRSYDARLSLLIDRATLELEDARPDEVAAWRRVLGELEEGRHLDQGDGPGSAPIE